MKTKRAKKPGNASSPGAPTGTPPNSPSILNILATTDFSDTSRVGVRYAISLAEKLGATVSLLHVVERPSWLSGLGSMGPVREESQILASAQAQLTAMAKREGREGVAVTASVRTGTPFDTIATAAREGRVELIVIATHGYTGAERALLGSTTERVVRHAPCPVLTVPARTPPKRTGNTASFRIGKILVPIDFSNLSKDALGYAAVLARQFAAELTLVHVVQVFPIDHLLGAEMTTQSVVPLIKQAETDLARMATEVETSTGVKTSAIVRDGTPHDAVCQAAKVLGADLVILTTHGHTGLKHVWLGSTAERVVRHAPCPVLVVRELDRAPL